VSCTAEGRRVYCGSCDAVMRPVLVNDLENDAKWLFWRCLNDSDHVTAPLPTAANTR